MTPDVESSLALSELVLADLSPAELPLIEAIGPQLLAASGSRRDGSLGMGVDEFTWAVAVLPVATSVVEWLMEQARDFAADEVGRRTKALLEWFRSQREIGRETAAPPPTLPLEAAQRVREVAYQKALAAGVEEARASLIAEAIAGVIGVPAT